MPARRRCNFADHRPSSRPGRSRFDKGSSDTPFFAPVDSHGYMLLPMAEEAAETQAPVVRNNPISRSVGKGATHLTSGTSTANRRTSRLKANSRRKRSASAILSPEMKRSWPFSTTDPAMKQIYRMAHSATNHHRMHSALSRRILSPASTSRLPHSCCRSNSAALVRDEPAVERDRRHGYVDKNQQNTWEYRSTDARTVPATGTHSTQATGSCSSWAAELSFTSPI